MIQTYSSSFTVLVLKYSPISKTNTTQEIAIIFIFYLLKQCINESSIKLDSLNFLITPWSI